MQLFFQTKISGTRLKLVTTSMVFVKYKIQTSFKTSNTKCFEIFVIIIAP